MLYITIWIFVLAVSLVLFNKVSGSLSIFKPNLVSLTFYYSLLITCFIGVLLIALNIDNHYMLTRLTNDKYRAIGFYLMCYVMVVMPLSMLMISKWLNFNAKVEYNEYLEKKIEAENEVDNLFFLFVSSLTIVCTASVGYTFLMLEKIPILELLKGATNLGELRIEASRGFKGIVQIRNIFAIGLPPILSLISYIYAVGTKLLRWKLLFVVLFGISILMNIYDLQKAPIFFYILMFMLVNVYIGKLKLNVKKIIMIGSFGVALLIVLYYFVQNVTSVNEILAYNSGPIGRTILSQIAPFYLHLDLYGGNADFLLGKSSPNILLSLYDIEQVRSARMVMESYFPERVEQGIAGVLNTIFAGEAFANFGYAGVLIGTVYIGIIVQLLYIVAIRLPKTPVFLSLFVFFTVNIPRVMVGGFTDFILNPFWLFLVGLLVGGLLFIYLINDIKSVYRKGYLKKNITN